MAVQTSVRLHVGELILDGRRLDGREDVMTGVCFELEVQQAEALVVADVLGRAGLLELVTEMDGRGLAVYVTRITAIATAGGHESRRYRLTLRSALAFLELTRRPRIFQHLAVPDIVAAVLTQGAYAASSFSKKLATTHEKREYVVQYDETDHDFVRRLCEEEGLWFSFDASEDGEHIALHDDSTTAELPMPGPLYVVASGPTATGPAAWPRRLRFARRPGSVVLRDYDYEHAAVKLEGKAKDGNAVEADVEVYEAPGGFRGGAGNARATLRLQQLRADHTVAEFETNVLSLRPGTGLELEPGPTYDGFGLGSGKKFVVGLQHAYDAEKNLYRLVVETIPLDVPYRAPRQTPAPRIFGLHHATVTGPAGSEIHTDEQGRVHLRFPWDREGTNDEKSSLPVRVAQSNLPGPMIIPRVGWEVLVAFEEGDPNRPVVIGKSFNGTQVPPQSLPANKTITSIATWSSPGGGKMNAIHMDDAAGRQNIRLVAAFAKNVTVANDATSQVASVEKHSIDGSKGSTVGANEDVSVKQAHLVVASSQSASVGGLQRITVKGNQSVGVGSETVLVGAALVEQVGNPVTGALNLAASRALAGIGARGRNGAIAAFGLGLARGGVQGFMAGGWRGAANAVAGGVLGQVAGQIPGGDAVLSAVTGPGGFQPFRAPPPAAGAAAAGGGAGGAEANSAAAQGPGPGHRTNLVNGTYTELVGGNYNVLTPGSVSWQTVGAATYLIGGSHNTRSKHYTTKTLGASMETLGSLKVQSRADIERSVRGAVTTQIAGAMNVKSGAKYIVSTPGALNVRISGALTLRGAHVTFKVGNSKIAASSSGVLIESAEIEISGTTKQSGVTGHT